MRPSLFRVSDLWLMWIPIVLISTLIYALVWNNFSPNGESIPVRGYLVSGLAIVGCLLISFIYYHTRYRFIKLWHYETDDGIACYYEPNCRGYFKLEVEEETKNVISKWITWGIENHNGYKPTNLHGVICVFRNVGSFIADDSFHRRVYGLTRGRTIIVAQGNYPIRNTAFGHELSHIILNDFADEWNKREVNKLNLSEIEAHSVFDMVGV